MMLEGLFHFMTPNETIVLLIQAINNDRRDQFYQVLDNYLKTLPQTGNYHYKIKNLLKSKPMTMTLLENLSVNIKNLVRALDIQEECVFVNDATQALFSEIIAEHTNRESFLYHNVPVRHKMLFHGHTGDGKTTLAREFARQIQLPLVEVLSDTIIDSHIGATSANIQKVFNSLTQPCVLFWDEIDSIGIKRAADTRSAADHENDRMTNSFLINFEKLSCDVIFIGATNRAEVLDSAFVRRFNTVHEIVPPNVLEKEMFLESLIDYHKIPVDIGIDVSSFNHYYQIKEALMQYARSFILSQSHQPAEVNA